MTEKLDSIEKRASEIFGAVSGYIARQLTPLRVRLVTLNVRQDLLEGRVAEIGETRAKAWRFVGTYKRDTLYDEASVAVWDGSTWYAERATTSEPGNGPDWRILAMRGRGSKAGAERGPPGERGPRPEHQWRETELRFERADGTWGEYVDLRGPDGATGGLTAMGLPMSSGGGGATTSVNGYFPQGW